MSKISCDIIQDMLPLYYDEVCSADSRKMIEEHLQECEKCSNIFSEAKKQNVWLIQRKMLKAYKAVSWGRWYIHGNVHY